MKAAVHEGRVSLGRLEIRELPVPPVGEGEALVRVRAAAINRSDVESAHGIPLRAGPVGWRRGRKHRIAGTDLAGTIERVGSRVDLFQPGDDVVGWAGGAFAEYVSTPAGMLVSKPARLTFEQAAATPTAAVAALQGLRDAGRIQLGDRVLVIGASGGVGTFAVQIAKAFGARVTGVCSSRNIEIVRSVGVDQVVDYTAEDFTRHTGRYDLILDLVGHRPVADVARALRDRGTYVLAAVSSPWSITGIRWSARAVASTRLGRHRLRRLTSSKDPQGLLAISRLIDTGAVLPVIDSVYDLQAATEAVRYVRAGHSRGKVVLSM